MPKQVLIRSLEAGRDILSATLHCLAQVLLAPRHLPLKILKQSTLILHVLENSVNLGARELGSGIGEGNAAVSGDGGGYVPRLDLLEFISHAHIKGLEETHHVQQ